MRPFTLDKSVIPLALILVLVLASAAGLAILLGDDAVEEAIKADRILNVLFVFDRGGKAAATELFFFYPATGRGAVLDVPGDTGLILSSQKRVDRIDAVYKPRSLETYREEIEGLLATKVTYRIHLDEKGFADAVDLLEGLELFIPQEISVEEPEPVRLPRGAVFLDGDKVGQYLAYVDPEEAEGEAAARRQKLFQAFIRRIGEKAAWVSRPEVFPRFRACFRTDLADEAFRRLIGELARLDADRLVLQRVTGAYRSVDGKRLLFPHYDGELVKDIVKQTLNALSATGATVGDKIFTVEILNGTPARGLAKRTAEIFQSFGYDVVSVGNATRDDYERTVVVDRLDNPEAARNLGAVIRCTNTSPGGEGEAVSDFTIILGGDFNGRYCSAR